MGPSRNLPEPPLGASTGVKDHSGNQKSHQASFKTITAFPWPKSLAKEHSVCFSPYKAHSQGDEQDLKQKRFC